MQVVLDELPRVYQYMLWGYRKPWAGLCMLCQNLLPNVRLREVVMPGKQVLFYVTFNLNSVKGLYRGLSRGVL